MKHRVTFKDAKVLREAVTLAPSSRWADTHTQGRCYAEHLGTSGTHDCTLAWKEKRALRPSAPTCRLCGKKIKPGTVAIHFGFHPGGNYYTDAWLHLGPCLELLSSGVGS